MAKAGIEHFRAVEAKEVGNKDGITRKFYAVHQR